MQISLRLARILPLLAIGCVGLMTCTSLAQDKTPTASRYQAGVKTRDGLGKYYFGREIAYYMSHVAAPWLDRPERDQEERPDLVMTALGLKGGETVADLGCGTGYFSWRLAKMVRRQGIVFGVEIQPEMRDKRADKL